MIKLNCLNCKQDFCRYPFVLKVGRGKFCSIKCTDIGMDKKNLGSNPNSKKNLKKMTSHRALELGFGKWMQGKTLPEETKLKISKALLGGNKGSFKKGVHVSPNTQFKKGHQTWNKGKGTYCDLAELIRSCLKYRNWRKEVYLRDEWTCIWCGYKGSKIQADHIKPFALILKENKLKTLEEAENCSELWDITNGRTLCVSCHKTTKSFFKSIEQWEDYELI